MSTHKKQRNEMEIWSWYFKSIFFSSGKQIEVQIDKWFHVNWMDIINDLIDTYCCKKIFYFVLKKCHHFEFQVNSFFLIVVVDININACNLIPIWITFWLLHIFQLFMKKKMIDKVCHRLNIDIFSIRIRHAHSKVRL